MQKLPQEFKGGTKLKVGLRDDCVAEIKTEARKHEEEFELVMLRGRVGNGTSIFLFIKWGL